MATAASTGCSGRSRPTSYNGQKVPSRAPAVYDVYHYHASPGLHNPPSQAITDGDGHTGFMGFDPTASQALGYVAQMQESGVPVTFAYIADAQDSHNADHGGNAYGSGQAGYVAQLRRYNQSFKAFFDRLYRDGINQSNTLFIFTPRRGRFLRGRAPDQSRMQRGHRCLSVHPGRHRPPHGRRAGRRPGANSRNTVAAQIKTQLDSAEFGGAMLDPTAAGTLIAESRRLIAQMQTLAGDSSPPSAAVCDG